MPGQDDDQNRRIGDNARRIETLDGRVSTLETDAALLGQSLDSLKSTFETGMVDLKDVLKARDDESREQRQLDRADGEAVRLEARWWWGKVFALVGSVLTLAGAGGGALYWQTGSEAPSAPVEHADPVAP